MSDIRPTPIILHTEDNTAMTFFTQYDFTQVFGISLDSFTRNEDALAAVREKPRPDGEPYYHAAIVDYHTESKMSGTELLAALIKAQYDGYPLVREILVLSSSTDRQELADSLATDLRKLRIDGVDKYADTVQIFDKATERRLAELFVALRTLHPEETKGINRKDMVHWAGYELRDDGVANLPRSRPYALEDDIEKRFSRIQSGELTLPAIIEEIKPFVALREGNTTPPWMRR